MMTRRHPLAALAALGVLTACSSSGSTSVPAASTPRPAMASATASAGRGPFRIKDVRCTGTELTATAVNVSRTLTAQIGLDAEFLSGRRVLGDGETSISAPVAPGDSVTVTSAFPGGSRRDTCKLLDYVVAMPDGSYPTYAP